MKRETPRRVHVVIKRAPTGRSRRDRNVPDKGTDVRAWISAFQNTKRTETVLKPDLGVIILRWRVGVRVFDRRCLYETRA